MKILELMVALINNEDTQQLEKLENELYYGDFDNFLNEYFHENWIIQKQNKL